MRHIDPPRQNWLEFDRYAVYGLGRSGRAAARLLAECGKEVVASDTQSRDALGDGELEALPASVELVFGENDPAGADVAIVSPGLSPDLDAFDRLERRGIPYCSEIDLAFDAADADVVAVTGTDGKTTTTTILGEMAAAGAPDSVVGGNIGRPLSDVVGEVDADGLIVAEVSAFQLWSAHHFAPRAAAVTNVAGDHLDYFDRWEDYVAAKRRLLELVAEGGVRVFNAGDATVRSWRNDLGGRHRGYSAEAGADGEGRSGEDWEAFLFVSEGAMWERSPGGETTRLASLGEFALPGRHNVANALCAASTARAVGLSASAVQRGLENVEPLSHRLEPVGRVDGVEFVDDSKATNVNSAVTGLAQLSDGYVAIVGGVDKGLDLSELVEELRTRARAVVAIGELTDRLQHEFREAVESSGEKQPRFDVASDMESAVERAFELARSSSVESSSAESSSAKSYGAESSGAESSGTVVLSPAASSFDMFESYEDRGETYRAAVRRLGP